MRLMIHFPKYFHEVWVTYSLELSVLLGGFFAEDLAVFKHLLLLGQIKMLR